MMRIPETRLNKMFRRGRPDPELAAVHSDASDAAEGEKVRIAEKVKFWEEQDRINQALIPRVLRMHDLMTRLAKQVEGTRERITVFESRLTRHIDTADGLTNQLQSIRSDLGELTTTLGTVQQAVEQLKGGPSPREAKALLPAAEGRDYALPAALVAIAIALVSLAVALLT